MDEILTEVARQTGSEVKGVAGLRRPVRARFSRLPLKEVLERLLAGVNFAMLESPARAGRSRHLTVMVLGGSTPSAVPAHGEKASPGAPPPAADPTIAELEARRDKGDWEALRQAASAGDSVSQSTALQLLAKHDPESAAKLAAAAMRSSDPNHRLAGIQALADLDSPAAAQALGSALKDADTGVRESAVMSLLSQTSPETVDFLTRAIDDREYSIRMTALEFLAQRGADGEAALYWASLHGADPLARSRASELLDQMR